MAVNDIQICTIRPVPEDKFIEAAAKAIEENPKNAPMRRLRGIWLSVPDIREPITKSAFCC